MAKGRKFTVVGGSGFIGTRLCQLMDKNSLDFEIVDLKPSRSFPNQTRLADIRNIDEVQAVVSGNVIINLAAVHRDDVRDSTEYYTTNVNGTRNLCVVAAQKGIDTIVFTSTVAVYGFCPPDTDESGATVPFNHYGQSKLEGEAVLKEWHSEAPQARHLSIVRPTVVFGEGNRGNVFNLLNQIAQGRFVMVGRGVNRKSMAYVGNVAHYLMHTATQVKGLDLVNYVDKPDFTMNALVKEVRQVIEGNPRIGPRLPYSLGLGLGYIADGVARISGRSFPISSIRVKKFCANTSFLSAAFDQSGFLAPFTLKEGLDRTLDAEFLNPDSDRETFVTE